MTQKILPRCEPEIIKGPNGQPMAMVFEAFESGLDFEKMPETLQVAVPDGWARFVRNDLIAIPKVVGYVSDDGKDRIVLIRDGRCDRCIRERALRNSTGDRDLQG